jgi:hypothetical protein
MSLYIKQESGTVDDVATSADVLIDTVVKPEPVEPTQDEVTEDAVGDLDIVSKVIYKI